IRLSSPHDQPYANRRECQEEREAGEAGELVAEPLVGEEAGDHLAGIVWRLLYQGHPWKRDQAEDPNDDGDGGRGIRDETPPRIALDVAKRIYAISGHGRHAKEREPEGP